MNRFFNVLFRKIKNQIKDTVYSPRRFVRAVKKFNITFRLIAYSIFAGSSSAAILLLNGFYKFLPQNVIEFLSIILVISFLIVFYGIWIFFIIILFIQLHPYNLRIASYLDYIKIYILDKNGELNSIDKKKISEYFSKSLYYLPKLFKKSKTGLPELDSELASRFSTLKKNIIDISKAIYFDKDPDLNRLITEIEKISQIIKERNFEILPPDPDYEPPPRERFWHRFLDVEEFQKHVAKWLALSIGLILFILILIIVKKVEPALYNEIIALLGYPLQMSYYR